MDEFISGLHANIAYWNSQDGLDSREKLEGCTHSILCMLDGVSNLWDGDIYHILNDSVMLHDNFYKKEASNG